MITNEKALPILSLSLIVLWLSMIPPLPNMHLNAQAKVETPGSSTSTPLKSSVALIQQSATGNYPNDDNNNTNS